MQSPPPRDAVAARVRNPGFCEDGPRVSTFSLEFVDANGKVIDSRLVEFDGNPYFPTLESIYAVVAQITAELARRA